ncbi:VOC family protein [Rhizobium paknamense]|uniref:Catechol 2,3-dioxygenase-like lactoylglutathione lyase family enzyme n=1 Tax=Rhizobium paknamense TaxID=1206817 RepID=A0ABU0IJ24_9HYPH|nr:VOC family protein [Rhizobium paknamense]MDQ0458254.1 catechol 2,3-dioxygenase-like lactoylglutathione lyase family enzyme [Rhizobium paknamense]
MLDHVTISVKNLVISREFYDASLSCLKIFRVYDGEAGFSGYGSLDKASFWIGERTGQLITGTHIAFTANNRADVDAFYAAALAAGGRDNGRPGLRPHYHKNYYGAFIFDPDGHKIEVVCHRDEEAMRPRQQ